MSAHSLNWHGLTPLQQTSDDAIPGQMPIFSNAPMSPLRSPDLPASSFLRSPPGIFGSPPRSPLPLASGNQHLLASPMLNGRAPSSPVGGSASAALGLDSQQHFGREVTVRREFMSMSMSPPRQNSPPFQPDSPPRIGNYSALHSASPDEMDLSPLTPSSHPSFDEDEIVNGGVASWMTRAFQAALPQQSLASPARRLPSSRRQARNTSSTFVPSNRREIVYALQNEEDESKSEGNHAQIQSDQSSTQVVHDSTIASAAALDTVFTATASRTVDVQFIQMPSLFPVKNGEVYQDSFFGGLISVGKPSVKVPGLIQKCARIDPTFNVSTISSIPPLAAAPTALSDIILVRVEAESSFFKSLWGQVQQLLKAKAIISHVCSSSIRNFFASCPQQVRPVASRDALSLAIQSGETPCVYISVVTRSLTSDPIYLSAGASVLSWIPSIGRGRDPPSLFSIVFSQSGRNQITINTPMSTQASAVSRTHVDTDTGSSAAAASAADTHMSDSRDSTSVTHAGAGVGIARFTGQIKSVLKGLEYSAEYHEELTRRAQHAGLDVSFQKVPQVCGSTHYLIGDGNKDRAIVFSYQLPSSVVNHNKRAHPSSATSSPVAQHSQKSTDVPYMEHAVFVLPLVPAS